MTEKWSRAVLRGLGSHKAPRLPDHIFRCNKPTKGNIVGVFIQPTEKGLKRIKQKIKEMTGRKTLNDDYLHKLEAINSLVRGWASYYRAVNPSRTFDKLDRWLSPARLARLLHEEKDLVEKVLQPLVGIAFVVLYLDSRPELPSHVEPIVRAGEGDAVR